MIFGVDVNKGMRSGKSCGAGCGYCRKKLGTHCEEVGAQFRSIWLPKLDSNE